MPSPSSPAYRRPINPADGTLAYWGEVSPQDVPTPRGVPFLAHLVKLIFYTGLPMLKVLYELSAGLARGSCALRLVLALAPRRRLEAAVAPGTPLRPGRDSAHKPRSDNP